MYIEYNTILFSGIPAEGLGAGGRRRKLRLRSSGEGKEAYPSAYPQGLRQPQETEDLRYLPGAAGPAGRRRGGR